MLVLTLLTGSSHSCPLVVDPSSPRLELDLGTLHVPRDSAKLSLPDKDIKLCLCSLFRVRMLSSEI